MRRILFLLLLLIAGSSFADVSKTIMYRAQIDPEPPLVSTKEAACAQALAFREATKSNPDLVFSSAGITTSSDTTGECQIGAVDPKQGYSFPPPTFNVSWLGFLSCPANSTESGGQCVCTPPATEQGGSCVPPPDPTYCASQVGQSKIVNVTLGWARTANAQGSADYVHRYTGLDSGTGSVCSPEGCAQVVDATAPCAGCSGWVSQTPASNGLYRVSADFVANYTGRGCSTSDAGLIPTDMTQADDAKDATCPGFVGEVNGVKGCYGNAETPVRSSSHSLPATTGEGNPSAGPKPESGEGSGSDGAGRTPSSGTGGSQGGPSAAAGSGTKPNGTTDKPGEGKEQAACGAPGQPKCGIDETGTPKEWGADKFDSKITDYRNAAKDARDQITAAGDSTFSGFTSFFFAPPLASCEAFELPNDQGTISKPCDVVEGVRSVMAYIWALAALFLCLGMIKKATA